MDNFFIVLVLLALCSLVLGLINPKYAVFWSKNKTRGKAALFYSLLLIFCFIGFGITSDPNNESQVKSEEQRPNAKILAEFDDQTVNAKTQFIEADSGLYRVIFFSSGGNSSDKLIERQQRYYIKEVDVVEDTSIYYKISSSSVEKFDGQMKIGSWPRTK